MGAATTTPRVTAVLVSYDSDDDLAVLLPRLDDDRIEVVIVDNGPTPARVPPGPRVRVLRADDNVGWARGGNLGAAYASAPVLAFVNPDARPGADDLVALAAALDDPAVGAATPRFVDPDGTPQAFYFRFPSPVRGLFCFLTAGQALDRVLGEPFIRHRTYDNGRELPCPVDQPGAACLLVRRDDFDRLGGFDPATFLFFADTDLCRRLAAEGLEVHVDWDRHVVHTGGASVSRLDRDDVREHVQRDYLTYAQRHYPLLARWVTRAAVVVLTGLLPASWHLLRRGPASARQQLCVTVRVLRRSGSRS